MRISDWSSDVCSSDLALQHRHGRRATSRARSAVERHLGVEHQQFVAVLAFANRERVDFDLLGIGAEECGIKAAKNFGRLLGEVTRQAERRGDAAAMVRLDSGCGIDRKPEERRVGNECASPCNNRWSPKYEKKQTAKI